MSNPTFKDSASRRAIVEDLDTCLLVEAGAGSGKTHSLVERMVALVKENKCSVGRMAAVTFTRKAAAELKGRFQLALEKSLARETSRDKKERLSRALNELDRCFLGTIHSFCAALLRERPVEAGLDPDFVEIEELEDALLRERAWEEYLTLVQVENPQALEDLMEIDVSTQDLKDFYKVLSTYPEVEVEREDSPVPDLRPVRQELRVHRHSQWEIAFIDAGRIARYIRWAVDGGICLDRTAEEIEAGLTERPRPADFMILLRYKSNMDLYARALEEQGIPFQIAGGGGFSWSAEIAELLKVLKALLDPDDSVRLVAVLRGGLFGLSDNQMWLFKQAGGHFSFYAVVPDSLDQKDRETFEWAFGRLRAFRKWAQELPASAALENIVRELGLIPYALTGELGRSRAGYLVQCLELLAVAEREGATSFASLVESLAFLMETGVEEEINIAPWENDAVRLMNLHKAKGLEAPVVFLANPGKDVTREPSVHINRTGGVPRGYYVIEKKKGFTGEILGQPLNWAEHAAKEQQYLDAEEIRLLYVAATRAKNLLVISVYPDKPEASPWQLFDGHFAGVPGLEEVKVSPVAANVTGDTITAQDLAEARDGFLGPGSSINMPSYAVASVTTLAKESGDAPERKGTGRGQSWGRVVHRVLEACIKKVPAKLELFIENVIAEEGRVPEEKEQVLSLVNEIMKSIIWQRMLQSKKRFVEVPFSVKVEDGEYGLSEEAVISGVIDLVFLEDDGWVIVDYKTDTVGNEEGLASLIKYYTPQVEMYRKFWGEMAKEKVCEAGLYFTHVNRWVGV